MKIFKYELLDISVQINVKQTFPNVHFENKYVIYKEGDKSDESIIIGYLSLVEKDISSSPLYSTINRRSKEHYGIDILPIRHDEISFYCIYDMHLIDCLSKQDLEIIFNLIAFIINGVNEIVIMWMEHHDNLLFYPLSTNKGLDSMIGFPSLAKYFAENYV